jgi:TP901 family phage tail tape measure protein
VIFRGLEQIGQGLESAAGMGWAAANAFETVMSRIKGLTTTPEADLAKMSDDVIKLSKTLNLSATELGQAEYFIASSGFAGKQATDVLTASAKAASAGLGQTKTIADAVTSALNAYKLGVGDAARITDVLTRAVVEGKGEPDQFAGALGRVLPIAAAAGVSFEQIMASMATMTRTGLSADEAATALRGTLAALLAPGKQAKEALESLGLSADEMRQMIKEKGLMAALTELVNLAGNQLPQVSDKVSKAMQDAAFKNSEAFTTIIQAATEKLAQANEKMSDLQAEYGAKSKDRQSKLNDDLADIAANLNDRLAEIADSHKEREAGLLEQISDLNVSYTESQADRKEGLEQDAADRKERKAEQRESILQRIQETTTEKEKKKLEAQLVAFDVQTAREEGKQAQKDEREQKRIEKAHQKQLEALQTRLKKEEDEYAKQQVKLNEQAAKREVTLRKQSDREAAIAKRGYDKQVESAREAMAKIDTDRVGALAKAEADFGKANAAIAGKFSPEELGLKSGSFIDTLDAIIPNIRGLIGVLGTVSSQGDAYAKILASMGDATGSVDKAFAASAGTWEFQFGRFKNVLLAMPIELGEKVLPGLTGILDAVTKDIGGKTSGWADLVAGWLGPTIGRLQAAAQTGGIQGVMAEIGKLINEGWTLHVQPKLQEWATKFFEWITGKDGAQAQVPSTMNKLLTSVQMWADDPKTQAQMAAFGEKAGRGLVQGVGFLLGQAETWAPIFVKVGGAMGEAAGKAGLEVGGRMAQGIVLGLISQLTGKDVSRGGVSVGIGGLRLGVGGTQGNTQNNTNQTIYGGVNVFGANNLQDLLASLVP